MNKKDIGLSLVIGFVGGLLLAFILHNFKGGLSLQQSVWAFLAIVVITPAGYAIGFTLSKRMASILQFVKYAEVGGLNFLIDIGVLNVLMAWWNVYSGPLYSVFKGTSFLVAVTNSYFWNKYWAFKATEKSTTGEVLRFLGVNIVGFGINVGIASLAVFAGSPAFIPVENWASIAAVFGSLIAIVWNFIGMKFFVFKK